MSGLIWKDLMVLRKTLKTYGLFFLFYFLMAAVGLFNSVINLILLFVTNKLSEKLAETSLW